jgi:hypothetical protein
MRNTHQYAAAENGEALRRRYLEINEDTRRVALIGRHVHWSGSIAGQRRPRPRDNRHAVGSRRRGRGRAGACRSQDYDHHSSPLSTHHESRMSA